MFRGPAGILTASRGRHGMTLWHGGYPTEKLFVAYKHLDSKLVFRRKSSHPKLYRTSLWPAQCFDSLWGAILSISLRISTVSQEFMPIQRMLLLGRCRASHTLKRHKLGNPGSKSKCWRLTSFHWWKDKAQLINV